MYTRSLYASQPRTGLAAKLQIPPPPLFPLPLPPPPPPFPTPARTFQKPPGRFPRHRQSDPTGKRSRAALPRAELAGAMEKYELLKDIGAGNFGVARLMRNKETKELVAMKYIPRGQKVRRRRSGLLILLARFMVFIYFFL